MPNTEMTPIQTRAIKSVTEQINRLQLPATLFDQTRLHEADLCLPPNPTSADIDSSEATTAFLNPAILLNAMSTLDRQQRAIIEGNVTGLDAVLNFQTMTPETVFTIEFSDFRLNCGVVTTENEKAFIIDELGGVDIDPAIAESMQAFHLALRQTFQDRLNEYTYPADVR